MWHSSSGPQAHFFLELLAYFVGARIYWAQARHHPHPAWADQALIVAGTIFGAFIGSKVLHLAEHGPYLLSHRSWELWLGGKSVLGGFLGGTLGCELMKKGLHWRHSTGDPWVPALAVGLMIGRLGCQWSGLWDQTYGNATHWPWAWDYGDGIGRHPTAGYEILGVAALWAGLQHLKKTWRPGAAFAAFMAGYCLIRYGLEYFKPPFGPTAAGTLPAAMYAGQSAIQWAALLGLLYFAWLWQQRMRAA